MSKKYYFDGNKIRSTSCRVTKSWVYTKNSVYPNNFPTLSKSKESAIKKYINDIKIENDSYGAQIRDYFKMIDKNNKIIKKLEKLIT